MVSRAMPTKERLAKLKKPKQHALDKYRPEYCTVAKNLIAQGATYSDVANIIEVSDVTLWRWQLKYPDFRDALRLSISVANDRVELSLFNQAVGFHVDDEEIKVIDGEIVRVKTRKFIPPNASASIYWTKAKMGWTDREQLELPPPATDEAQIIDGIPDESPRQRARRIAMVLIQGGLKETG